MALDTVNALVSLAEAKAFLKINSGVTSEDDTIEQMINRASNWANEYTRRLLLSRVNTEFYDGDGTSKLILSQYPVTVLTSLNDDPARAFAAATDINVSTDVILTGTSGIITLFNGASAFNKGTMNVKVVYTAGYTTVPDSIKEAVLIYVATSYRREYADQKFGVTSESIGDRTTTFQIADAPAKSRMLMDQYRSEKVWIGGF